MIVYEIGDSLYLNITNRCTNRCSFCIRSKSEGVAGYNLRLEGDPDIDEAIRELFEGKYNPEDYKEIVFCGYGEPLCRLDAVKALAKEIKSRTNKPIRINTNGTANLYYKRNILPELEGLVDVISVSLNAESAEKYNELCSPAFGEGTYEAVKEFIREATKYIPRVVASVVDLPEIDIEKCAKIAEELGAELRIRSLM